MRITNYYVWSVVLSMFYIGLCIVAVITIHQHSEFVLTELAVFEYILLALATWRLTRLFTRDTITAFLREQFYDRELVEGKQMSRTPQAGVRRVLADLFACPWCMSIWMALLVVWVYLLTPWAQYAVLLLSLSAVVAFLQILTHRIGSSS